MLLAYILDFSGFLWTFWHVVRVSGSLFTMNYPAGCLHDRPPQQQRHQHCGSSHVVTKARGRQHMAWWSMTKFGHRGKDWDILRPLNLILFDRPNDVRVFGRHIDGVRVNLCGYGSFAPRSPVFLGRCLFADGHFLASAHLLGPCLSWLKHLTACEP